MPQRFCFVVALLLLLVFVALDCLHGFGVLSEPASAADYLAVVCLLLVAIYLQVQELARWLAPRTVEYAPPIVPPFDGAAAQRILTELTARAERQTRPYPREAEL